MITAHRAPGPDVASCLARDLWDDGYDVTVSDEDPCVLYAAGADRDVLLLVARSRAIPLHPTP